MILGDRLMAGSEQVLVFTVPSQEYARRVMQMIRPLEKLTAIQLSNDYLRIYIQLA